MRAVELGDQSDFSNMLLSQVSEDDLPPSPKGKQSFSYRRPELKPGKTRGYVRLVTTDILFGFVQVFEHGGETIMHSHAALDGLWMPLKGRVRFHFDGGETCEAGPMEGVCVPRGVRYWFEKVGDETLEILQVEARNPNVSNTMETVSATDEDKAKAVNAMSLFDAMNP